MDTNDAQLPIAYARRLDIVPEQIHYMARPGLFALPPGSLTVLLFITPQIFSALFLLWAIWWPMPSGGRRLAFALIGTAMLAGLVVGVLWFVLRRHPGFVSGAIRAPFISLTVTDRRVLWTLPWRNQPLFEIDRRRVIGGILGSVDRKGRGHAAMMLRPGDPAADIDGNIHFDRLPNAARFIDAICEAG